VTHLRLTALEFTGGGLLEALGCARVGFQLWHRVNLTILLDNVIQNSTFSWCHSPGSTTSDDVLARFRHTLNGDGGLHSLVRLGDSNGGHAGRGRRLDADVGVLEDEAVFGVDAEAGGGEEEGVGGGLAALIIARADEGVEEVEEAEGFEGSDDRFTGATRDDGEGDVAVLEVDLLEHFGDGLELVDEVVVEALLAMGKFIDGNGEAVALIELCDDVTDGHATERVEKFLGEVGAAVLGERLAPGDVVERHGVGDGAVAVEEVGLEVACRKVKDHTFIVSQVGVDCWMTDFASVDRNGILSKSEGPLLY
jgi:hypothetical protein